MKLIDIIVQWVTWWQVNYDEPLLSWKAQQSLFRHRYLFWKMSAFPSCNASTHGTLWGCMDAWPTISHLTRRFILGQRGYGHGPMTIKSVHYVFHTPKHPECFTSQNDRGAHWRHRWSTCVEAMLWMHGCHFSGRSIRIKSRTMALYLP